MKLLFSEYTTAAENLAYEEFLFNTCEEELLLLYINQPSVIIGSNQVVENEVNVDYCKANNIKIIRRISGGGAVYHDTGNLNYSFIFNRDKNISPLADDFLIPVIHVLQQLEIPVKIGKRKDLYLPGEFKISGTASHINKNKELHHGTLLFNTDLDKLQSSLNVSVKDLSKKGTLSVPGIVKNIYQFLLEHDKNLQMIEFVNAVIEQFEQLYNTKTEILPAKNIILNDKYQNPEWNFKK